MNTIELNKRDLRHINKNLKYLMEQTICQYMELNIPLTKNIISYIKCYVKSLKKYKNKQKYN
ncbi:hypothetical protein [Clostridium butyricum]